MPPQQPRRDDNDLETVVGTIDTDDVGDTFVIADISAEGAWISMRATEAPTLQSWR